MINLSKVRSMTFEELQALAASLHADVPPNINWGQILQIVIQALLSALLGSLVSHANANPTSETEGDLSIDPCTSELADCLRDAIRSATDFGGDEVEPIG